MTKIRMATSSGKQGNGEKNPFREKSEFKKKLKIREKSGNLFVNCFHMPQNNHFHSFADLATGGFFLLYW